MDQENRLTTASFMKNQNYDTAWRYSVSVLVVPYIGYICILNSIKVLNVFQKYEMVT